MARFPSQIASTMTAAVTTPMAVTRHWRAAGHARRSIDARLSGSGSFGAGSFCDSLIQPQLACYPPSCRVGNFKNEK
jgi:hypothetical protein